MKFIFVIHKNYSKPKSVLILDRDGVVIEDTGYPHKLKEIIFEDKKIEKIKSIINKRKFDICGFATNQSGVGRKYFSEMQFWKCHNYIINFCLSKGLNINFSAVNFFTSDSYYRKPNCGMLDQIKYFYKVDNDSILFVGDKTSDAEAAKKANISFMYI